MRYYEVNAEASKKFKMQSKKLHNSTFLPLLLLGAKSIPPDFKELEADDERLRSAKLLTNPFWTSAFG